MGSGKIKELEADNRSLQNEIAAREESIEDLQASLQRQRAQYGRELATVQTDYIQKLEREKERTAYLQNGRSVRAAGSLFSPTRCAWRGTAIRQASRPSRRTGFSRSSRWSTAGNLLLPRNTREALAVTGATAQMGIEQGERGKRFVLRINGKNILDWFREQFERLLRRIRPTMQQPQRKNQGIQTVMIINTYVPT